MGIGDLLIFVTQFGEEFCPLEWRDTDGDTVLDDSDFSGFAGDSPCPDGASVGCDDNCITVYNPDQTDTNGDGIGDVCTEYYTLKEDGRE